MSWKSSKVTNKHVKAWRKRVSLSVSKAAKQIGVGRATYYYYENGSRLDSNGEKLPEPKKVKIPKMFAMACLAFEHLPKDLFNKMGIEIEREDK